VYSSCLSLQEDGVPIIAFRIANIRKHQIIEANVRLLVAFNNTLTDEDESMFNFTSLPVIGGSQVFLGLPCTVKHPITTTSPLYGLTLKDLENADMEILVLLEGVDASTSSKLQGIVGYEFHL
jgi:inward rectifier potassium channel